jgi:hypothetical protein
MPFGQAIQGNVAVTCAKSFRFKGREGHPVHTVQMTRTLRIWLSSQAIHQEIFPKIKNIDRNKTAANCPRRGLQPDLSWSSVLSILSKTGVPQRDFRARGRLKRLPARL